MNENITIIDKNNNGILAEGIAFLKFPTTGKRYVIYTLNELVKNNMKKIYVGEVGETAGTLDKILDEEWAMIRDTLMPATSGNPIDGVECLPMGEGTFMIGIPKKLAVSDLAKQTLRGFYIEAMATRVDTSSNEPAVGDSNATPQFFSPEVSDAKKEDEVDTSSSMVNIFDTPMTPALEENTSIEPTIMPQPAITNTEVKIVPDMSPKEDNITVQSSVTKEEAIKALDVLTCYIKGEGETLVKEEKREEPLEISESAISLMDELSLNDSLPMTPSVASTPVESSYLETPAMQESKLDPVPQAIEPMLEMPALNVSNNSEIGSIPNTQIIDMDALDDFETIETPAPVQNTGYTANNNGAALQMGADTPSTLGSQVVLPNNYMNQQMAPGNDILGPGSLPTE